MAAGELPGVFDARRISGEQRVDKPAFTAKTGQDGDIDIQRGAGLAPSLHRQPTDAAGAPALPVAEGLQLASRRKQIDHRGSLANHFCISTNREEGLSVEVRNA